METYYVSLTFVPNDCQHWDCWLFEDRVTVKSFDRIERLAKLLMLRQFPNSIPFTFPKWVINSASFEKLS